MITICRQCELLDLSRASYYYRAEKNDDYNLLLMKVIDEQFTETPFYGVPKMTAWLKKQGHPVNRKRVRRLMRLMGLEAIYPKRRLSIPDFDHKKYPYLLRGLEIDHADQVWCADLTYIRMQKGFIYLVAIMDWYSRYILSWEISTTMDKAFCILSLEKALSLAKPEIFNTDQGAQFTSQDFTGRLEAAGVKISMDGQGRAYDNIFIERLWRTVKYVEVYLHDYRTVSSARFYLSNYFHFYNTGRIHEALGYKTPYETYFKEPLNQENKCRFLHLKYNHFLS